MQDKLNQSSFEGELVKIYDKFFYNKRENVIKATVEDINKKVFLDGKTLADIGCGTGIYDPEFSRKGANVIALDCSGDMIEYASANRKNNRIRYIHANICQKPLTELVDVVVSLSHVIGYQLTNIQLRSFVKNISMSMKQGGQFYFNFYHQPAVMDGSLRPQYKVVRERGLTITRISNASLVAMENVLQLDYKYIIEQEAEEPFSITISEKMRYFSVLELENILWQYGFRIIECNNFLSSDKLEEIHWNGCIIARKE